MTGDLILPHHNYPIPGNTNKVINYESQREIFLSRQESFPMQSDINMNNNFIQNIATPTSSHQVTNKGYCDYNFLNRQKGGVLMGPLSMNRNDLTGIPDTPKFGYSAVNKNYVDGEISKIPGTDTSPFLKIDGTRPMTGDLDMNHNQITKIGEPNKSDDASTKNYVDSEIAHISSETKKYFDEKLLQSHLLSAKVENAFKYLSDVDESSSERNIIIHGIVDFNNSPHKNKKAYDIDMVYSAGSQNYNSKMGINIYPLDVGKYTIIMEYYFPEDLNIIILAEVTKTTIIKKQVKFDETNYKKYLVQFDFPSKANPPHYLYFTIRGSGTTSTNPEGYIVLYGVKGWDDMVPSELYDHALETGMFEYDNGNMKMFNDIDMNNHRIKNISPATNPTDLLMRKSLEIHDIFLFGLVNDRGFLSIHNFKIKLENIFIKKFIFYGGSAYANTQDDLLVNAGINGSLWRYPFRFGPANQATEINFNKYFNVLMNNFRLILANQIEFELIYLPVTFKTT